MIDESLKTPGNGKVCILMCTFQGEKHLSEQLESIRNQTYRNWQLFVSDDGSTDNTLLILRKFQASLMPGQMEIFVGPGKGFAENFMALLLNPSIQGNYYSFSDQDDFWYVEKLSEAVLKLNSLPGKENKPAVYASARALANDNLELIGYEGVTNFIPSFNNALVENIAGGNTIIFNKIMRDLLLEVGDVEVVSHDWWVYLVCTGAGGTFYYDKNPHLLYRQHSNNVLGSGPSWRIRLNRLLQGHYRRRINVNLKALEQAKWVFTRDNAITMERFKALRNKRSTTRVLELLQSGIHRQSRVGTLGLVLACLLKRV